MVPQIGRGTPLPLWYPAPTRQNRFLDLMSWTSRDLRRPPSTFGHLKSRKLRSEQGNGRFLGVSQPFAFINGSLATFGGLGGWRKVFEVALGLSILRANILVFELVTRRAFWLESCECVLLLHFVWRP